jgi:hypothetical protein
VHEPFRTPNLEGMCSHNILIGAQWFCSKGIKLCVPRRWGVIPRSEKEGTKPPYMCQGVKEEGEDWRREEGRPWRLGCGCGTAGVWRSPARPEEDEGERARSSGREEGGSLGWWAGEVG